MNKKNIHIVLSVLIFSLAVSFIDAFVKPNYFVKIPIKILFFLVLPMIFFFIYKEDFEQFKKLFTFKKSGFVKALLLALGVYGVIVGGFFATRSIIDYSNVTTSLTGGMGITADNFLYVALYISLMNSFLEEFFFRGFGFITLKKFTNRKFAYIFSAAMFAFYHAGMLWGMFGALGLALIFMGLVIGGCIFSYLNESNDNIYPSWFVHMFANFAINTVGFILFGVI
ncbi:MAG: CPBP family intramembrane metalloprotease [Oscillospiraceae bacterium]|nr:CPBP family intramembrane metalloprotease [Oscillospiraceae bacterium]